MKKVLLSFCTVVCSALFFTSCTKDEAALNANLMIVNASPNGGNLDAAVNGSAVASGITYPGNSGYKVVTSGSSNVRVTESIGGTEVLNGNVNLEGGGNYSLYIVDSANKRKATIVRDDLSAPSSGKAKVRFFHLSPNAPAVDLALSGSGSTDINFTNRGFNDISTNTSYSAFQEVDAAGLNVTIKLAGTSSVIGVVPIPALTAGKIYTFFVKGFASGTGSQAFGIEVIQHN